jgi:hypothetical protein
MNVNRRTTSFVAGKRICERDEMLEAAWKPRICWTRNAHVWTLTLDRRDGHKYTLATRRSSEEANAWELTSFEDCKSQGPFARQHQC